MVRVCFGYASGYASGSTHRGTHRGTHHNNSPPILYSFLRLSFSEYNAVATYTWLPCTSSCLAQKLHYTLYF
eukprot:9110092-Heterocapsa_arctica.AAC.1